MQTLRISVEDHKIPTTLLEAKNIPEEFYMSFVDIFIYLYNISAFNEGIYTTLRSTNEETQTKYVHNWISNSVIAYILNDK